MVAKITLSFDETGVTKARQYAVDNNISHSRLFEFLKTKLPAKATSL